MLREGAGELLARSERLLLAGEADEAMSVLRELFSVFPDHVNGNIMLARIHRAKGASALAIRLLEDVLALEPEHLSAGLFLAELLSEDGQLREARRWLEQCSQRAPSDPRVAELRTRIQAATQLDTLRSTDPFERPSVARRLASLGRVEAALAVWEQLAQQHPEEYAISEMIQGLQAQLEPQAITPEPLPSGPSPRAAQALQNWAKRVFNA